MNYIITTFGGGELFTMVFNGIAVLFKADKTGILMPLIRVGLMTGCVYMVILMLFRSSLIEGIKWFLWVVIATNLLLLPKTTVYIDDPLLKTKNKVDNIPLVLGMVASFVSQSGRIVTENFESVFVLPDYMPYHKTGTVFASSLMSQVGNFRIVDPVFKGNMERFVNQCVVYDAMIGQKYTLGDLQNTKDIWAFVSGKASPVLGFLYKDSNASGKIETCKEGAKKLNALWKTEIEKAAAIYGNKVQNQALSKAAFFTHLQNSYQLLSGVAESAENLLKQTLMINAIEEGTSNKLSELGSPSNYAATKALLQQRSAYAVAGEIAARTLPLFKNVVEAFSYALFLFVIVLALLPNGYRILLTYAGILAWTQLWAPLYAILNLVMTLYGKFETTGHIAQNGLTLLNSAAVINANADMVTLAAWLSVSIPFISYGILKQGAGAFVSLAQHLGSAMQSAASSAAAETVSGNVSLGNVSVGTQAYQNTSAFQHNTSPAYNSSHFKATSSSGVEQSTFADGTQSLSEQALSRLGVQIMGTENTTFAQQESLNKAMSVMQSKSIASGKATESAIQQSTNFLERIGRDHYRGEDRSDSTTSSEGRTLQNFRNYVQDIRQSTGLNESQATEAAVAANLGANLGTFVGLGASGRFSSSAARQQAIESAKSVAQQTGYTDSVDKVVSAAQHVSEGHSDTKGAELGQGAHASLNKAQSLREEFSVAQNQVDSLSRDISRSQSRGLSINKDLTQEVLEFIAQQPSNPGPNGTSGTLLEGGRIGYEGARHILENGGDERAAYLQRFQEQNPQYAIQGINKGDNTEATQARFTTLSDQLKHKGGERFIEAQSIQNTQDIQNRAKDSNSLPSTDNHNREESLQQRIEQKLASGFNNIAGQELALQQAKTHSEDQNMTQTVFKNAGKGIIGESMLEKARKEETQLSQSKGRDLKPNSPNQETVQDNQTNTSPSKTVNHSSSPRLYKK